MKYIVKSQMDLRKVCFCNTNGANGACDTRTKK